MQRIFIALKVEAEDNLLKMISTFKSGLSKEQIKWTDQGNIHITLAFLGDTEEYMIKNISLVLKNACAGSGKFELVLRGSGVFRSISDPRIIWTGIDHSERLFQLYESIMNGLKELNIKIEDRTFNPHLTLGRVKRLNYKEELKSLVERYKNQEIQIVSVNEVILYESILSNAGPVYKPLTRIDLSNYF